MAMDYKDTMENCKCTVNNCSVKVHLWWGENDVIENTAVDDTAKLQPRTRSSRKVSRPSGTPMLSSESNTTEIDSVTPNH
ncbi:hypothetical protein L209DRAFT_758861 [Thermothelomyces heterothallicus CBS 203.75]